MARHTHGGFRDLAADGIGRGDDGRLEDGRVLSSVFSISTALIVSPRR
jgi:hypothetical protein